MRSSLGLLVLLALAACSPVAAPCATGQQSCGGTCVDLASDSANCGACGTACAAGNTCVASACLAACAANELRCSGTCVTPLTDSAHCGSCSTVCGTGTHCANGGCMPTCATDQTLCSGACVTTANDDAHCGACTTACTGSQHCVASTCTTTSCTAPQQLCGTTCTNTTTDSQNCGGCGQPCVAVPHGTPGCSASACHVTCDQGFVDADGQYANGCELDVRTDLANCGGAGVVCAPGPHVATAACSAGICGVGTCTQGFADCDGLASNGCEVDLQNTATHCGACGTACTALPNAAPACAAGQCVPQCQAGFANCDGAPANGCEVPLNTASNCGACGGVCTPTNGTGSCSTGSCQVVSCSPGFADCNLNAADGCEANLASATSCGSCSNACGGPNAMYQCVGGGCQLVACAAGFSDCDASPATGCEVHTAVDPGNCGSCGTACSSNHATPSCLNGNCAVASCAVGFANCDNNAINGCEVSTSNNPTNCGGCNVVCSTANGTPNCVQGQCTVASCNPGFADCDLNASTGCETHTAADPNNCGNCGNVCGALHATSGCSSGACTIAACNPGYRDCNGLVADGCETNTTLDRANCGGCGIACAAAKNCVNSICQ